MSSPRDNRALQETLRRAASGDEMAWRDIVDAYSGRVFALIRAQCANPELAEEITQSTFCTIVAKLESYTERGKFESWLFHIAMNRLRDEMRRRKRHARPMEEPTLAALAGSGSRGKEPAETADPEDLAQLNGALERLGEADRRIIHLRHFAGLSFKQIAEVLEEPLGTVLARQHRALKKLREFMDPESES